MLKNEVTLQYTVPYWLMWYLLALAMWELLAASIKISKRKGMFIICATAIVSLLIGYDNNVGYFLSFSRMIVLLPFFMLGIWLQNFPDILTRKYSAVIKGMGVVGICLCGRGTYLRSESIKSIWLYHGFYSKSENKSDKLCRNLKACDGKYEGEEGLREYWVLQYENMFGK